MHPTEVLSELQFLGQGWIETIWSVLTAILATAPLSATVNSMKKAIVDTSAGFNAKLIWLSRIPKQVRA